MTNWPRQIPSKMLLRKNAVVSSRLPLHRIDACPEDVFNRILWHAMRGSAASYPNGPSPATKRRMTNLRMANATTESSREKTCVKMPRGFGLRQCLGAFPGR
jgi:hypothetical protein